MGLILSRLTIFFKELEIWLLDKIGANTAQQVKPSFAAQTFHTGELVFKSPQLP